MPFFRQLNLELWYVRDMQMLLRVIFDELCLEFDAEP